MSLTLADFLLLSTELPWQLLESRFELQTPGSALQEREENLSGERKVPGPGL